MNKRFLMGVAGCMVWAGVALAETFDFDDPKGVNAISLFLDAPLEPIVGWVPGVTGKIKFDPLVPDAIEGSLAVPAKNITFANPRMTEKAQTAEWLDVEQYPTISFTIKDIEGVKEEPENHFSGVLVGTFSLHGVEKSIKVPGSLHVIPDGGTKRGAGKGDLMVFRMKFQVNRSEYGIKPGVGLDNVAEMIQVTVAISGYVK